MESSAKQTAIPRSRFCSDDFPVVDRFDAWSDSIASMFRPHLAEGVTANECVVKTDAFLLDEAVLGTSSMLGVGGYYNPGSSPLRSATEIFIILRFWRGGIAGYNGAQALKVNVGDIVIMDTTRGITLGTMPHSETLALMVSRRQLMEAMGNRLDIYPRVIPGHTLTANILGNAIFHAWKRLPQQTQDDTSSVCSLLVGAVAGLMRGTENGCIDSAVDHATLTTICAYIERHLADPELGPELLCKRFHCSRARLYRMFAPLDGVANYIRRLRLERAYATLRLAKHKVKIAEMAMDWGFGSVSNFNRLFRNAYGLSPGDIKNACAEADSVSISSKASQESVPEYQTWLQNL